VQQHGSPFARRRYPQPQAKLATSRQRQANEAKPMDANVSETRDSDRDVETGRFLPGNSGAGGGRLLIPLDVAHDSEMISPAIPI
jgi:hypothetical protein